jgi:sugar transferase (PEP-CTERM/EpsH1 system associated)
MSEVNPRVLHALLSLECGGMEQVVVDLVQLSRECGQYAEVMCFERYGELARQLQAEGIVVHCLNKRPGLRLGLGRQIVEVLDRLRPNILHTHQIGSLFYSGRVAIRHGVKAVVHTEHGKEYNGRRRTRWLARIAAHYATRFCCVSDNTAQHVADNRIVARSDIDVVYNGIDIDRFIDAGNCRHLVRRSLGLSEHTFLIGTVGRLSEIKRQDILIDAFALFAAWDSDSHLMLVGDGPQRTFLTKLADQAGLSSRVHFMGYQSERENFIAAMDLFTLTSDSEGTPLSLLEAWAAGRPVAVTAVGGLPELVSENETGKLVPPANAESLAHVFRELRADQRLRNQIGQEGQRIARMRFDRRVMAKQYDSMYRELLKAD